MSNQNEFGFPPQQYVTGGADTVNTDAVITTGDPVISGAPTKGDISVAVADVTNTAASIVGGIRSWVAAQVDGLSEQIYAPLGKLLYWIETEIGCVKSTPGQIYARCSNRLDDMVCPVKDCAAKYSAVIEKAAKKARGKSPCAPSVGATGSSPIVAPDIGSTPVAFSSTSIQDISALAGLWLVSDADGVAVQLDQLPREWWSPSPSQPWYVSLSECAGAICKTPVLRVDGDSCSVVGELYVCSTAPLPDESCQQLLVMLGVPRDAIYDMPPAPIKPPNPPVAPTDGEVINFDPVLNFDPVINIVEEKLAEGRGPVIPNPASLAGIVRLLERAVTSFDGFVALIRSVIDWIRNAWNNRRLPTADEVCAFLEPIYDAFAIPRNVRVGCVDIADQIGLIMSVMGA